MIYEIYVTVSMKLILVPDICNVGCIQNLWAIVDLIGGKLGPRWLRGLDVFGDAFDTEKWTVVTQ